MNILFIGGTGNISTSVSRLLLQRGEQLTLLNRSGFHPELEQAQFLRADIHDEAAVKPLLADLHWDVVVNWIAFTEEDIERDIRLFGPCCDQYVFISSASCYQNPGPTSFITERTPLENPYWEYSRHKIAAEKALMAAHTEGHVNATIVRPSHTYANVLPLAIGGWTEYTAVARFKQGKPIVVHGDGSALWTLTHADDFARGFVGLLGNPLASGEDFHITSDEFLSWDTIYRLTANAVGCEAKIVHVTSDLICAVAPEYQGSLLGDKSQSAVFDNAKIKQAVPGFEARIPYAEGVVRALEWFHSDPRRQQIDPETDALIDKLIATTA